jgi:hypothetical protein
MRSDFPWLRLIEREAASVEMHADLVRTDWDAHVEDQVAQVILVAGDHLVVKGATASTYEEVLNRAIAQVVELAPAERLAKLAELVAGSQLHVTDAHGYHDCPFAESTRLTLKRRRLQKGESPLRRRRVSA